MEMNEYPDGLPSWVDVSTPDLPASRAFYAGLFGWDTPAGPDEMGGYTNATLRGRRVAGISPMMNPGAPPAWSTYVNVVDADATAAKVTGAGGQVFAGPMDVMDIGRMAVFADPAGAVFGIWQAGTHKGAELVNEANAFGWNELITTDVEVAKAFYGAVFGWGSETQGEGSGTYIEWKLDGRSIGGMMPKPDDMPAEVPPYWGVYFGVDDLAASMAKATELGGTILMGPMDTPAGPFSIVVDPVGAMFNIIELAEHADE